MDPTRFDHLTRLLSGAGGRRAVLRALLGAVGGGAVAGSATFKEPWVKATPIARLPSAPGAGGHLSG